MHAFCVFVWAVLVLLRVCMRFPVWGPAALVSVFCSMSLPRIVTHRRFVARPGNEAQDASDVRR